MQKTPNVKSEGVKVLQKVVAFKRTDIRIHKLRTKAEARSQRSKKQPNEEKREQ
jgi:hypothetical protein